MYKLYGYRGSGSAAIEMALNAVGEPYRVIDVASWAPDTPVQELAEINPLKQIPTLVLPDGTVLTESASILIYLGDTFPSAGIIAHDSILRAKTIQGLVYLSANCYPAVGIMDFPDRWTSGKDENELENIKSGTRKRLYYLWEIFTDIYSRDSYLSGPGPGVLDFYTVTICRMFSAKEHLKNSRPEFYKFLDELENHPLIKEVVKRHWDD